MNLPPFEITILGTSSAIPAFERFPTAQFIQINGSYILIDAGEGTQMQLRKYQLPFARIDIILISHLHGDHIFGLPGLITSLSLLQRQKELIIVAPPTLKDILQTIFSYSEAKVNYPIQYIFTQTQYPELIYENDKFQITTIPLKHRVPTTGFVIQEQTRDRKIIKEKIKEYQIPVHQFQRLKKGMDAEDANGNIIVNELVTEPPPPPRKYTYLSDTAYMEKLPEIIFQSDVLYHETTFLKEHKNLAQITMHSTTEDAAKTAIYTNARKLVIGHFSSRYENLNLLLDETKSIFPNTELAIEGKKIKL
ncbi:MAG: ribonuclease Z [Bacteroidia bacterium]